MTDEDIRERRRQLDAAQTPEERSWVFPAKSGEVALTSDVPSVDTELSATSTNPIQNQWLGKRLGATSTN